MKKALSFLFILALLLTAAPSFAETKHIGPLEFTPESYDLNNGEFWFETDIDGEPTGDSFIMTLYLEDRYEPDEIKSLKKGDTVEVDGKTYTVDVVVIHGWYDSNGDGKTDAGYIFAEDQETAQYILERYGTEISQAPQDLVPTSYEIYFTEDYEGYLAFDIGDDGYCHPVVNDATFRTKIGTVEIPLPLPETFIYHYEVNWTDKEGTAQDFLSDLEVSSQYTSIAWFKDGKLVEARRNDWPAFLKNASD